jgi:hypothetical protein
MSPAEVSSRTLIATVDRIVDLRSHQDVCRAVMRQCGQTRSRLSLVMVVEPGMRLQRSSPKRVIPVLHYPTTFISKHNILLSDAICY